MRDKSFPPDCLHEVRMIAAMGMTDGEIAEIFDVPLGHILAWKKRYRDFGDAIASGRTRADAEVIGALYKRAVGFSQEVESITKNGEKVRRDEYFAPDVGAIRVWLNARRKDFREKVEVNVNVNLAGRLERALRRVEVGVDVVEGEVIQPGEGIVEALPRPVEPPEP